MGSVKTYHIEEEHTFQNILQLLPCSNLQQHMKLYVGCTNLGNKCRLEIINLYIATNDYKMDLRSSSQLVIYESEEVSTI